MGSPFKKPKIHGYLKLEPLQVELWAPTYNCYGTILHDPFLRPALAPISAFSHLLGHIFLDPLFECQISAPNGLFLVVFGGAQISDLTGGFRLSCSSAANV